MSNLIPPLVSCSPPPMVTDEREDLEDDEFGDFTAATDLSFEGYSLPTTPQHASYSNFTSNSLQTSSNLNISPKMKDHLETNKVSENIFCDIKDINTTFVNNKKPDEICNDIANQDVQSETENFEKFVPTLNETLEITNDTSKGDKIKEYSEKANDLSSEETCSEELQGDGNHSAKISLTVKSECDLNEFNTVINNDSIIETQEVIVPNNETIIETESKVLQITGGEGGINISNSITESQSVEKSEKVSTIIHTTSNEKSSDVSDKNTDDFGEFKSTTDIFKPTIEEVKFKDNFSTNIQSGENNFSNSTEYKQIDVDNKQIIEDNRNINEETSQKVEENEQIITGDDLQIDDDESDDFTCVFNEVTKCSKDLDDEFGDFSSPIVKNNLTETNIASTEAENEDDDFGNFNFIAQTEIVNSNKFSEDTKPLENDLDGIHSNLEETVKEGENKDDEFGDFTLTPNVQETEPEDDFDEFGDFNDYTQEEPVEFTTNFDISTESAAANAEEVINNIFMDNESDLPEIEVINFIETNIFKQLHDIENTNALNYQWATSDSQKTLLRALNIDSRNILFGPRWNASMPRFAANLGFTPLEPVKSELPGPSTTSSGAPVPETPVPETPNCEVPAAKFDWTSSGLVNPLDYTQANTMLLDLGQLVPSLDIPNITLSPTITPQYHNQEAETLNFDLDSWDFWLQTQSTEIIKQEEDKLKQSETTCSENSAVAHLDLNILNNFGSDNESVNSLKFIEPPTEIEEFKEPEVVDKKSEDDFSSFQCNKSENWKPTLVPQKVQLKESHISSEQIENKVLNIQQFELESTIVTPELSRKNLNIERVEDEEFTDFQMSLPTQEPAPMHIPLVPLEPLKPVVINKTSGAQINWPEPGIINESIGDFDFYISETHKPEPQKLEAQNPEPQKLEPQKPEPQKLEPQKLEPQKPEPQKLEPQKLEPQKPEPAEEDDWSDFVCAEHPQKMSNHSHLELSVPNLQNMTNNKTVFIPNSSPNKTLTSTTSTQQQQINYNYQPPYQIPLHTINTPFGGLPQTSLSTYNNFTIGPTELPQNLPQKNKTNDFGIFDGPFNSEMKPFQTNNRATLSHPIQAEFQMNSELHSVESTFLKMQQPTKENDEDDDDDWTDFVSSQPVNQTNGFGQQKPASNHFNIIPNPVHFDAFQSFQSGPTDTTVSSKKPGNSCQSVPSISALPELDFIAPKNKFFSKK